MTVKQSDFNPLQTSNFFYSQSIEKEKDVMISFIGLLVVGVPHYFI